MNFVMAENHIGKIVFFSAVFLVVGFLLGYFLNPVISNPSRVNRFNSSGNFQINSTLENQTALIFSNSTLSEIQNYCSKTNEDMFSCISYCRQNQGNQFCTSILNSSNFSRGMYPGGR